MSIIETMIDVPADHMQNVCGQLDSYMKKIERSLRVSLIPRDDAIKIIGPEGAVKKAKSVFSNLLELSHRGNTITEQNVDYALSLSFEEKDEQILEIDKDIICRTIAGKPIKPKTVGQKTYVDAIREKMIVFRRGTGRNRKDISCHGDGDYRHLRTNEVNRIILTRPAIEAGEKLGFLPGDLQSKSGPVLCGLFTMRCIEIMGADTFC